MPAAPSPESNVYLESEFAAAPATVWRAWTDPGMVRRWFGSDPQGTVLDAALDVRPGGGFEVTFRDSNGTAHTCSGEYLEVAAPTRLKFTWRWRSEPGVTSCVTVQLRSSGEHTLLQFEHSELTAGSSHNYAQGWRSTFDKLTKVLAGMR